MGPMTTTPTYERPVSATMIVRLATGEEFEAKAEDFAKFGYVDRDAVLADWRAFVEDAIGSDVLHEDAVLTPFWHALFVTLNSPEQLSDQSMGNTKADVQDLDRIIREHKAKEAAF